jgi:tetratricopeptide (TPR) repeat protein
LVFADEQGLAEPISGTQFARLVADHDTLRLVVLNACEGASGSALDIFASTAATLMRRGIPAVLSMQRPVSDEAAIIFAHAFYRAIADSLPVDAAVTEARKATSLALAHTLEWATPVLHMRSPNGHILDIKKPGEATDEAQNHAAGASRPPEGGQTQARSPVHKAGEEARFQTHTTIGEAENVTINVTNTAEGGAAKHLVWYALPLTFLALVMAAVLYYLANTTPIGAANPNIDSTAIPADASPAPTPAPAVGADDSFNITIAQFGQVTDTGYEATDRTRRFTVMLCNYLEVETRASNYGLNVFVNHKNMPIVTTDLEAAELAAQTNADLVVYGNVAMDGDMGTFLPRFYVTSRNSEVEVSGYNQLAHPIRFSTTYESEEELNRTLQIRAAILVNYVKGLVYLNVNKRNEESIVGAVDAFEKAVYEAEKQIAPFEGQEVLYLMHSYAQKLAGDYDEALISLEKALTLNPDYPRAWIGLGNVYYARYTRGDADPVLLDQAWDYYLMATETRNPAPGEYIYEKAQIGFGNIEILRIQQHGDISLLESAAEHFQWVVERHEQRPNDQGLERLAAYAQYNLGWLYDAQGDFAAAKTAYQRCLELPTDFSTHEKCRNAINAIDSMS